MVNSSFSILCRILCSGRFSFSTIFGGIFGEFSFVARFVDLKGFLSRFL
jgi:hypothetical protein